jgi:hypothetical protein
MNSPESGERQAAQHCRIARVTMNVHPDAASKAADPTYPRPTDKRRSRSTATFPSRPAAPAGLRLSSRLPRGH